MEDLTRDTPKPLLNFNGKSLLQWKIENLPDLVDEVIIVIGYLGDKISSTFGNFYSNKKITYVWDKEIKGTGMALWQTQDILKERFLVMMGDDLYSKQALEQAAFESWSITVKEVSHNNNSSRIETDENGRLVGFLTADRYREKYSDGGLAFTGLYSLSKPIFDYPLVKMKTKDEWGLPQTLLQAVKDFDIKIIKTDFWIQITSPQNLLDRK